MTYETWKSATENAKTYGEWANAMAAFADTWAKESVEYFNSNPSKDAFSAFPIEYQNNRNFITEAMDNHWNGVWSFTGINKVIVHR